MFACLFVVSLSLFGFTMVVGMLVTSATDLADGDESVRIDFQRNLFMLLVLYLTNQLSMHCAAFLGSKLKAVATARLQRAVARRVLHGGKQFEKNFRPGELANAFNSGIAKSEAVWQKIIYSLIFPFTNLVAALTFLSLVHIGYAMLVLVSIPIVFCLKGILGPKATNASARFDDSSARLLGSFQNIVGICKPVKVHGSQDFILDRFDEPVRRTEQDNYSSLLWSTVFGNVFNTVGFTLYFLTNLVF